MTTTHLSRPRRTTNRPLTVDALLAMDNRQFRDLVSDEVRGVCHPATSDALRHSDVLPYTYSALWQLRTLTESQITYATELLAVAKAKKRWNETTSLVSQIEKRGRFLAHVHECLAEIDVLVWQDTAAQLPEAVERALLMLRQAHPEEFDRLVKKCQSRHNNRG